MVDLKTKPLPASLRADRLGKTSLRCRFGWHEMIWGKRTFGDLYQEGECARCGILKDRSV